MILRLKCILQGMKELLNEHRSKLQPTEVIRPGIFCDVLIRIGASLILLVAFCCVRPPILVRKYFFRNGEIFPEVRKNFIPVAHT
ncbi:hypothetical protein V1515DRAFT_575936 [Lipomyces mesembrius]